ncbi:MAG TPA: response regulator [Candidatus Paenibacillus intestinavium]|nr:response regulator [Candidatus Paenibacillus intestinavium]
MNILLVDDDYFVIKALETRMDWSYLQINQIYTAQNITQAKEIIMKHPIQILVSDIDMPQGTGLELLAWVRDQGHDIQSIILTNYADFNYAQKAIELQSFEYFLKPIEFDKLMLIIQKAIAQVKKNELNEQAKQKGYLWKNNQLKVIEHFWRKLILNSQSFPMKRDDLIHSIAELQLPYCLEDNFHALLFNLYPHYNSMGITDKGIFDFAFENVFHEIFHSSTLSMELVMEHKEYSWIAIFRCLEPQQQPDLEQLCHTFIAKSIPYLKADASCSMGLPESLEKIPQTVRQLMRMNEEIAQTRNQIIFIDHYQLQAKKEYSPPDLAQLEEKLYLNKLEQFILEIQKYLRSCVNGMYLEKSILSLFRLDITQLVYSFLKSKEILTHKLYSGKSYERLFSLSLQSIENMEEYITYLVRTAMEYIEFTKQSTSVVEEIKQYIHEHIGEELTRNSLAEVIYLNPDYLARLFKKEIGISLGTYITKTRISAAKQLLDTSTLSIYSVANKVGYPNYSYFSKLFKQDVGVSPNEYKKG